MPFGPWDLFPSPSGVRPVFYFTHAGAKSIGVHLPHGHAGLRMLPGDHGWVNIPDPVDLVDGNDVAESLPESVRYGSISPTPRNISDALILPAGPAHSGSPETKFRSGSAIAVFGKSGSGKSLMLSALAATAAGRGKTTRPNTYLFRVGEPGSTRHPSSAVTFAGILNHVARAAHGTVYLIDSLAALTYEGSGAAAEGGLSRSVFSYLALLDAAAYCSGAVVFAVINPLTSKDAAWDSLAEGLQGVCSGTIYVQSSTEGDDASWLVRYELTLRPDVRQPSPRRLTFKPGAPFPAFVVPSTVSKLFR